MTGLMKTDIKSLPLVYRGKVRECYAVGTHKLLMVCTDRISAFDSILSVPIPYKGEVLNKITEFWFDKLAKHIPNQLTDIAPESVVAPDEVDQVRGRAMLVKRFDPIRIECVARGYIVGGGWKSYQEDGTVCGIKLPAGLKQAQKLPEPIFTPAHKEDIGTHDENISFERCVELYGEKVASRIRDLTLTLYKEAAEYALTRGIIIADTKFEFGLDANGEVNLMDEVLTPDSSRFWPQDTYQIGTSPNSFDKQFLRDWLESIHWNKVPPAPVPPEDVIEKTSQKYREAYRRLTGKDVA